MSGDSFYDSVGGEAAHYVLDSTCCLSLTLFCCLFLVFLTFTTALLLLVGLLCHTLGPVTPPLDVVTGITNHTSVLVFWRLLKSVFPQTA